VENKIDGTTDGMSMLDEKSFAEAVKQTTTKDHSPKSLREIIKEARNEEQKEDRDKKVRRNNIIIHGIQDDQTKEEQEKWTNDIVTDLFKDLAITINAKKIERIGFQTQSKRRPIKVTLKSQTDKDTIMKNLKNLKGITKYGKISVTDDYTKAERQMFKTWTDKAKEMNDKEPEESTIIWRVRGSPTNGIYLKKFEQNQTSRQ